MQVCLREHYERAHASISSLHEHTLDPFDWGRKNVTFPL